MIHILCIYTYFLHISQNKHNDHTVTGSYIIFGSQAQPPGVPSFHAKNTNLKDPNSPEPRGRLGSEGGFDGTMKVSGRFATVFKLVVSIQLEKYI